MLPDSGLFPGGKSRGEKIARTLGWNRDTFYPKGQNTNSTLYFPLFLCKIYQWNSWFYGILSMVSRREKRVYPLCLVCRFTKSHLCGSAGVLAAGGLRRTQRQVPPRFAPYGCFRPSWGRRWITIPNCAASRGGGRFTGWGLAPPGQGEHHPAGGTFLWKMQNKTKWALPQSSR